MATTYYMPLLLATTVYPFSEGSKLPKAAERRGEEEEAAGMHT